MFCNIECLQNTKLPITSRLSVRYLSDVINIMYNKFQIFSLLIFVWVSSLHNDLIAQQNCLAIPSDFIVECGEVDWGFIYTNTAGAFAHPCDDINTNIDSQINLQIQVDSLNCGDLNSPSVVVRISRIFSTTAAELVDYGCGLGILCGIQIIDIVDTEPPEFTVFPGDTAIICEDWDLIDYLLSGEFQVDFSDNCSDVDQNINLDIVPGTCDAELEFRWEFSLVDGCNNTRIDTHVVNVIDTIGPIIAFLPPQIFSPTYECKDLVVWPLVTAIDMCSLVEGAQWSDETQEDSLSCPNHWILTRWAFATDACGNRDSAIYTIDVKDESPPTFLFIPQDMAFSCSSSPDLGIPTAVDGCLGNVNISIEADTVFSNCPHNYTINRTFIATDNCMNEATATQQIVVSDTEPPSLTTPLSFIVECGEEIVFQDALAMDNCDAAPLIEIETDTINILSTGAFTIVRTFTASDACGNSVTSASTITVQDNTPPFFTEFPPDITISCGEAFPEDMPVFQDGCDPSPIIASLVTDENYQDCANESVVLRIFEIQDDAGNTHTQTQAITFFDNTPPFFTFIPEDITVGCTNEIEIINPEYDDLCSANGLTLDITVDNQDLGCDDMYDYIRTYTITDACGLSVSESQTIFIRDTTPPTLTTELDSLSYYCSYNVPSCEEMLTELVFADECGSFEFSSSCFDILIDGNCEEQACLWERTYYWEDGCGNQSQASHVIRVQETTFTPDMPTGITPNSDDKNDAYVILDIGPLIAAGEVAPCDWIKNTMFRVLNRWGQLVFEQANYRNDWKGTSEDGSDLPSGTYFIVFEASGEAFSTYVDIRR